VVGTYKRVVSDYGGKFPHLNAYFYSFLELYNLYSSPNIRMITYRRDMKYSENFKWQPFRRLKNRYKDNTDVGL
jgi:hypothetical protein